MKLQCPYLVGILVINAMCHCAAPKNLSVEFFCLFFSNPTAVKMMKCRENDTLIMSKTILDRWLILILKIHSQYSDDFMMAAILTETVGKTTQPQTA